MASRKTAETRCAAPSRGPTASPSTAASSMDLRVIDASPSEARADAIVERVRHQPDGAHEQRHRHRKLDLAPAALQPLDDDSRCALDRDEKRQLELILGNNRRVDESGVDDRDADPER